MERESRLKYSVPKGLETMSRIPASIAKFWKSENGLDLIEYTLVMAFLALASVSIFIESGGSIRDLWTGSNNQLTNASQSAS
jgi:Flp pilus assembly pilin Flp